MHKALTHVRFHFENVKTCKGCNLLILIDPFFMESSNTSCCTTVGSSPHLSRRIQIQNYVQNHFPSLQTFRFIPFRSSVLYQFKVVIFIFLNERCLPFCMIVYSRKNWGVGSSNFYHTHKSKEAIFITIKIITIKNTKYNAWYCHQDRD